MTPSEDLNQILERIGSQQHTAADLERLRSLVKQGDPQSLSQLNRYNVQIDQVSGGEIQVGDRVYVDWNDEAMQALIRTIQTQLPLPSGGVKRFVRCRPRTALLTSLGITAAVALVRFAGALQPLELQWYDHWAQNRLAVETNSKALLDERFAIVQINQDDLRREKPEDLKGTSISNERLEQLLKKLKDAGAMAIGLDLYRGEVPLDLQKTADRDLAERFRSQPNLFMVCKSADPSLTEVDQGEPPPNAPAERTGFSDFLPDPDGVLRRQLLAFRLDKATQRETTSQCKSDRSFNLLLASYYLQQKHGITVNDPFDQADRCMGITFSNQVTLPNIQYYTGGYQGITTDTGDPGHLGCQILINYRTDQKVNQRDESFAPTYSLDQALNTATKEEFHDRIVLIGSVAGVKADSWSTPFGSSDAKKIPGVVVQAQMISHLLDAVLIDNPGRKRPLIWVLPQWGELLWVVAWGLLGGALGWWVRSPLRLILALGGATVVLYVSCFLLFIGNGWLPFLPPLITLLGGAAGVWAQTFRRNLRDEPQS